MHMVALKTMLGKDKIKATDYLKTNSLKILEKLNKLADEISSVSYVEYYSE